MMQIGRLLLWLCDNQKFMDSMTQFAMDAKREICDQIMRGMCYYLSDRLKILHSIYVVYKCKIFDDASMKYTSD